MSLLRAVSRVLIPALLVVLAFAAKPTLAKRELAFNPGVTAAFQGTKGKVGEVVSDGRWRLEVLSVELAESYTMQPEAEPYDYSNLATFDSVKRTFTSKSGYALVLLQCRVVNLQHSTQRLWIAVSDKNIRTALIDMDGGSHPPIGYDLEGAPVQSRPMTPQAVLTFPVVFTVPKGARLKELIFTLHNNDYSERGNDVHVSLVAANGDNGMGQDAGTQPDTSESSTPSGVSDTTKPGGPLSLPASGSLIIE